MTPQTIAFASSAFWPIAIGFFGLGTGYFIWGGQGLFGYPKSSPEVDRSMGMWGFWMPGFCQFLTGVYLIVGLTWFGVFTNAAALYMTGLAFTLVHVRSVAAKSNCPAYKCIRITLHPLESVEALHFTKADLAHNLDRAVPRVP